MKMLTCFCYLKYTLQVCMLCSTAKDSVFGSRTESLLPLITISETIPKSALHSVYNGKFKIKKNFEKKLELFFQ